MEIKQFGEDSYSVHFTRPDEPAAFAEACLETVVYLADVREEPFDLFLNRVVLPLLEMSVHVTSSSGEDITTNLAGIKDIRAALKVYSRYLDGLVDIHGFLTLATTENRQFERRFRLACEASLMAAEAQLFLDTKS